MSHELAWRSKFVWGTGVDISSWETTHPSQPWIQEINPVGGSRTSAAGVPAAHVVRRDYNLAFSLRVLESELPDLYSLLEWGQGSESFTWYPDADDTGTSYTVYLEAPLAGERWQPSRDPEFPHVFLAPIVLRQVDGYAWDLPFFTT